MTVDRQEMPEFPAKLNKGDPGYELMRAEVSRAMAAAWEARCRVAVEALHDCDVAEHYAMSQLETNHAQCVETVREALALIGPLPELPERTGE